MYERLHTNDLLAAEVYERLHTAVLLAALS